MKKLIFLFILLQTNAMADMDDYHWRGTEYCPREISHTKGAAWQLTDPNWTIVKADNSSPLEQVDDNTVVVRKINPYDWHWLRGFIFSTRLADITCDYASGTVVLTRTYTEENSPYSDADYIGSENLNNRWDYSDCMSTIADQVKKSCGWSFYVYIPDE